MVSDLTGNIVEANRAARTLVAPSRQAVPEGPLVALVARGQRRRLLQLLGELRFGRLSAAEQPVRFRVDGRSVETAVSAVVVQPPGEEAVVLWSLREASGERRAEAGLRRSRTRLRALRRAWREKSLSTSARCLEAREEEARRIAHALHDDAGQVTAALGLVLHDLEPELPGRLRPRLRQALALVLEVEERLRGISHELRPTVLDDLGFAAALGFLAESFSSRTGIFVDVKGEIGDADLDALGASALYRVAQEALANVTRHARAGRVVIELRHRKGALRFALRDDGVGFDPARAGRGGGLGLIGMRERIEALGGSLLVRGSTGRGTEIVATLKAGRARSPAGS